MDNQMDEYNKFYGEIKQIWDSIAKPLDSLGELENLVCKLGAVQKSLHPEIKKSAVIVLCADNGIVEESISQSDKSVTAICTKNIAQKKSTVGVMASFCNADVFAFDLGIDCENEIENVINKKIRKGTRNFLKESAMTKEEASSALECGKQIAATFKQKGYDVLCIGEMGIGNTTTSSAVAASLLKTDAQSVTGRGAGLSDEGLKRKISVIDQAISKYDLYNKDAFTVLQTVGGFDIAGMTGVFLGAKEYGIPVILDGAISMVAALVAQKLCPDVVKYLIPSHKSREPLVQKVMTELKIEPVIDAKMALGEGTGAVLMISILKTALEVYEKSVKFNKSGVEQYKRFN